jgi:ribosomal protein S27E
MSFIKFECPACDQPIEAPFEGAGEKIKCPNCSKEIEIPQSPRSSAHSKKIIGLAVVIFCFAALAGGIFLRSKILHAQFDPDSETKMQHWQRLDREAHQAIQDDTTNEITGYTRTISLYIDEPDENIAKWRAELVAEFVNSSGGVERTNLPFVFRTDTDGNGMDQVSCSPDFAELARRDEQKYEAELKAIENSK